MAFKQLEMVGVMNNLQVLDNFIGDTLVTPIVLRRYGIFLGTADAALIKNNHIGLMLRIRMVLKMHGALIFLQQFLIARSVVNKILWH